MPSSSSSSSAIATTVPTERELPMLAAIGGAIRWIEELAAILSGPLLTAGLGIALVALLTDGQLLVAAPWLLWCWAVSQAVGVDAQIVGSSAKLARAARQGRWLVAILYALLIVALGYVAYLASNVFATQQAQGITTAEALQRLGMDSTSWIVQRSSLSVLLVVLSGMLRYTPPAARQLTADEMLAHARLKAAQAEANALIREAQLRGMGSTGLAARQMVGKVIKGQSTEDNTPHDDGPGGGLTPQSTSDDIPQSYGDLVRITPRSTSAVNNRSSGGPARQSSAKPPLHRRVAESGVITVADLVEALGIGEVQARSYLQRVPSAMRNGNRKTGRIEAPVGDVLATLSAGPSAEMKLHGQRLEAALHPRRSVRRDRQSSADAVATPLRSGSRGQAATSPAVHYGHLRAVPPQSDADRVPQSDGELVNA